MSNHIVKIPSWDMHMTYVGVCAQKRKRGTREDENRLCGNPEGVMSDHSSVYVRTRVHVVPYRHCH